MSPAHSAEGEPSHLDPEARAVFELVPVTVMVAASGDGRILELNARGRQLLGAAHRAGGLRVVPAGDAGRLLLAIEGEEHDLAVRCMPLPGREDAFLAVLAREAEIEPEAGESLARLLPSIGAMTDRILHDVRNLILPLVCHMDLAMASVDPASEIHRSLLDVQAACRRCESELGKLSELGDAGLPERWVHVEDVIERAALLLRYVLPRRVEILVQPIEISRLIRVSPTDLQRLLIDIASLAQGRRRTMSALRLGAREIDRDVVLALELAAPRRGHAHDFVAEEIAIGKALAGRIDGRDVEAAVTATPAGLEFTMRLRHPATADPSRIESTPVAGGRGERVLVLHPRAMMRDLLVNYLRDKGYQTAGLTALDELLPAIERGADALVADVSDEELRELRRIIERAAQPPLSALVICRARPQAAFDLPAQHLDLPYRMDDVAGALRRLLDSTGTTTA